MQRVLLVDDEKLILYSLSKTFRHDGAEVTEVSCGKTALEKIRQSSYDVCFLDVNLPDANGLELLEVITRLSPNTRVVIMTANQLTDEQVRSIRDKGCWYLPKPFSLEDAQTLATGHQVRRTTADR